MLVNRRDAEAAAAALRSAYAHRYGEPCDVRLVTCSAGARIVR